MKNDLMTRLRDLEVVRYGDLIRNAKDCSYFIDLKKAYGDPTALRMMSEELWKIIDKRATCVIAGGYGGLPLASVLSASHYLPLTLVREEPKDGRLIEGHVPTAKDLAVIFDDVCLTGRSIEGYEEAIKHTGAQVLGTYVIINRGSYPVQAVLDVKEL